MIAPTDNEGFIISFAVDEEEKIGEFFKEFGFVCVRDVLTRAEVEKTADAFFAQFDKNCDVSVEDFFSKQRFARLGVIGLTADVTTVPLLENRQNPNVYKAFCTITGETELIVDHDRFGALRPTFRNGVEKPEWRTIDRWLHLDCNPITGSVAVASFASGTATHNWNHCPLLQGFISLTDAREQDGGFHCVPGSHKFAPEWCLKNNVKRDGSSLSVEAADPMREHIQRINVRSGCLLAWDSFLFHANRPNNSDCWRLVQYIRMYPAKATPFKPLFPNEGDYPPLFQMTALGKRLFGVDEWK